MRKLNFICQNRANDKKYNPSFNKIIAKNVDFSESTSVRYHNMKISKNMLLQKLNMAFLICYTAAFIILASQGEQGKLFDEPQEEKIYSSSCESGDTIL